MAASPSLTNLKLPPQSTVVSWLGHRALSSTFGINSFSFSRRRRHHQPRRYSVLSMVAKPTILVAEKLGDAGLKLLKEFANVDCSYNLSVEELCTKILLCDAPIVRSGTNVSREVFEASAGRLKVVGRAGVGIDKVDLAAATEHGCLVLGLLFLRPWPEILLKRTHQSKLEKMVPPITV